MGNQLTLGGTVNLQELHLQDLGQGLVRDRTLGGGRLLKSVRCLTEDGSLAVVKVYLKREDMPEKALELYYGVLKRKNDFFEIDFILELVERLSVSIQPNVLGYLRMVETDKAGYLTRQYCYSNLADRVSTRPFFTNIIKKWIVFQLLHALDQLHQVGLFHGDLKAENVVLTAWDWAFITDLAPFKPRTLSVEEAGQYSYFFDTGERQICLFAPERFYDAHTSLKTTTTTTTTTTFVQDAPAATEPATPQTKFQDLTPKYDRDTQAEMFDIFSAGCLFVQLYLEGEPLFITPTLLEYRKGEMDHLNATMAKLDDKEHKDVKELLLHMLQRDPSKRLSAAEYISKFTPKVFPPYFEILHSLLSKALLPDSDERIEFMYAVYGSLMQVLQDYDQGKEPPKDLLDALKNIGEDDMVTIEESVDEPSTPKKAPQPSQQPTPKQKSIYTKVVTSTDELLQNPKPMKKVSAILQDAMEILASAMCCSLRNAKKSGNRLNALSMIQDISAYCSDNVLLQRLVPYTTVLLTETETSPVVKAAAIRALTTILSRISNLPASEVNLFNDYVIPALRPLTTDASDVVKTTFAEYLPLLAYQSKRYLEMAFLIKQTAFKAAVDTDAQGSGGQASFDTALNSLQDEFKQMMSFLSIDECSQVKIALLKNIIQLCIFFGVKKTDHEVLPILTTFLNFHREWRLKFAYFEQIVGISVFVGPTSLKEFILPCIIQALYDAEEFVVEQAISSLISLCELGMFKKSSIIAVAKKVVPLLHHPNTWIRYAAIGFFAACAKKLGTVDTNCFLLDILKPHLDFTLLLVTEYSLLEAVKPAIDRFTYDQALNAPIETLMQPDSTFISDLETKSGRKLLQEDTDKLRLLKPYLEQTAKAMQSSKAWDTGIVEDTKLDVIKLAQQVPIKTYIAPIASSFAEPLQNKPKEAVVAKEKAAPTNVKFNNEWDLLFNKPPTTQQTKTLQRQSSKLSVTAPSNKKEKDAGLGLSYDPPQLVPTDFNKFRPHGHIFAQSNEHKYSINEIAVYENQSWFVTCSNDSTVKLWDLKNLEKDITFQSKATYSIGKYIGQEEKICSVTMLPSTMPAMIACATEKGSIHYISPDVKTRLQFTISEEGKVTNRATMETDDLLKQVFDTSPKNACAVNVVRPFAIKGSTVLICGNRAGRLVGIDHRQEQEAFIWKTQEAIQQGPITTMCGEDNWLMSATRRGFITLWDLRFQMPVLSVRVSPNAIHSLGIFKPSSSVNNSISKGTIPMPTSPSIYIGTGSTDIQLWNMENQKAYRIYQCCDNKNKISSSALNTPAKPVQAAVTNSPTMGQRKSSNAPLPDAAVPLPQVIQPNEKDPYAVEELKQITWDNSWDLRQQSNFEVRSIVVNTDGNFYTGGTDRKIRFWVWDHHNQEKSLILSGLEPAESCVYKVKHSLGVPIVQEQIVQSVEQPTTKKGAFNVPVSTYHLDTVTDIKLVGTTYPLLLTASRDGVLKVWK